MNKEKDAGLRSYLNVGSLVLWAVLILVVVLVMVMGAMKQREARVTDIPEKAVLVRAQAVVPRAIHDTVVLPGRVEADVSVRLSVEKGGRIVELPSDRGDTVKAGQVLLQIDSRQWESAKKQTAIEFADAQRDLARWGKLKGEGAVSSSDYDAMQLRRDLAEVAVEEVAIHLSQCTVVSPIDGVIDGRYVELGEYVSEAQAVFNVVSEGQLNVALNVPEKDVHAVAKGAMLQMRSAALSNAFAGCVVFVAVRGDPHANTFAVELAVDTPPAGLKPGMIVDVELLRAARDNAIVVPFSAVIPKRGEHIVFVVEEGRAVLRVVQIDAIVGQDVVLASGLKAGERLVVEGQRTLQDGVLIAVDAVAGNGQE